jgi:hypothetical protein
MTFIRQKNTSSTERSIRGETVLEILPGQHTVAIGSRALSSVGSGDGSSRRWQNNFSQNAQSVTFEAKAGHMYSPEIIVDQQNGTFKAYVEDITDRAFWMKSMTLNSIKASYPGTTPYSGK